MGSTAPSKTPPTLYTYKESGNSYKVRLLAALLNIDLSHRELDFLNDQQHSADFLAINPRGEVPTLVDGPHIFTDSAAILTYLAGTHPDPGASNTPSSYWSSDAIEQAKIVDWLAFAASWVQYGVFTARAILSFKGPYNGLGTASTEQSLKEATIRGYKSLGILDLKLGEERWLALGRPTIADIAVFVYVALAPMGDISLEKYANVRRWIEDVKSLEGFIPIDGLEDPLYRRRG
ncbi:glutathione S-transferase protein-like protein [Melanomma pulvis-pyrius CBS 109.77]|uniref:Glutathione S-transferase protein-like protein n=1 Tax=Melanomma pulvis-pyrius CBS 109.77 TaxID=1314802 RepID=A0A6A6XWX8_9PLEO|nr:glutathione S-transferase protein-like protein [Melanomma pulvis-pyrius CBS 109.77]